MRSIDGKENTVDHDCNGNVYYKHCQGCAKRLLSSAKSGQKQLMAMRDYLVSYNGHDPAQIDAIIAELRVPSR